jgi:putative DNA primase/helicase
MVEQKLHEIKKYVEHRFQIFPLFWVRSDGTCSCNKPCNHPGKHPLTKNGFYDASSDINKIQNWLQKYPQANWGLVTGEKSRLVIIDIDQKSSGFETWAGLTQTLLSPIDTLITRTGNGGKHLWFWLPPTINISSRAGALGPGVDIKANGGYIVVPPSKTTQPYVFETAFDTNHIAPLPDWILEILARKVEPKPIIPNGKIPEGHRHQALVSTAVRLRSNGRSADDIRDELFILRDQNLEAGSDPISNAEIEGIVKWINQKPILYNLTDLGNAERFVDQNHRSVRWCDPWGQWVLWNGKVWERDIRKFIFRLAQTTVRTIYSEAAKVDDESQRKAIVKHGLSSESQNRTGNMLEAAKPLLAITPSEFDQFPMQLNVRNGIVDLTTGELSSHDPSKYHTKMTDIDFLPNVESPAWKNFLKVVTSGDQSVERFLQIAVGYSLTGLIDAHCFFFLYGSGANGKSTFVETLRKLAGSYYSHTSIEGLLAPIGNSGQANPHVANLAGSRLVVASEIPDSMKVNEALIKDLTGGDIVTARYLYGNPFAFRPNHKLWMFGNYRPRITGVDTGIWRRVKIIPFNAIIPEKERRPMSELLTEFEMEMPGILNWAIQGCLEWQRIGLDIPASVNEAIIEYRADQDVLSQFLLEKCRTGSAYKVRKDYLYQTFIAWCVRIGEEDARKRSQKWFTQQLGLRGYSFGGHADTMIIGLELIP